MPRFVPTLASSKERGLHHPVPLRRLSLRCCRIHIRPRFLSLIQSPSPQQPLLLRARTPQAPSQEPGSSQPRLFHELVLPALTRVGLGPDTLLPLFVLNCQGPRLTGSSVYLPMICGDCPSEAFVSAAGPTARPSPSTSGTAPRLQPGNARLFRPPGARLAGAGADGTTARG